MSNVKLQELSAPGCQICKVFEDFWHSIQKDFPNVEYENIDITTSKGQELVQKHMIFSSPGIVINGELFSSGGFDRDALIKKLKDLSL